MMTTTPQPRSLVPVADLAAGDSFHVPALAAPTGGPSWWTVARLVPLVDNHTRVVLMETDHEGRPYHVQVHTLDYVVWAAALAPRTLAVHRLGHDVTCPRCRRSWGYLPVTTSDASCYLCDKTARVGI